MEMEIMHAETTVIIFTLYKNVVMLLMQLNALGVELKLEVINIIYQFNALDIEECMMLKH
jgi:hypothetical protein